MRASSGMIGTIRLPICGSRSRLRRIRAKTMVVETSVALPPANSPSTSGAGLGSGAERTTRRGTEPPRLARRSIMYSTSSEPEPGWKYG